MKKLLLTVGSAILLAAPLTADAQVFAGNTNRTCTLGDLVGVIVTKCAGFYTNNGNSGGAGNATSATQNLALAAFGYSPTTILEKWDLSNGPVNPSIMLYGITIVGFHWGNGNDVFKTGSPAYNGSGGGSAYYLFDAGSGGIDSFAFSSLMEKAISNAVVLKTCVPGPQNDCGGAGGQCTAGGLCTTVPEPSTYALMAAGLAGVGMVARRRRNTKKA